MIKITKSPSADTRTAEGPVSKKELLSSSKMHIEDVQNCMLFLVSMMCESAMKHDYTKIEGIDDFYDSFSKGLKNEEFKKEKWFKDHIRLERHHLTDNCPDDVTLIDVMERVADITSAGMARSGDIKDVDIDPEILVKAYKNTVKLLKDNIKVVGK